MKVKVITHSSATVGKERRSDLPKLAKNADPLLHPFEKPREMVRALNAVKIERLLAKPFLGSLEGHRDGVYTMARHARVLTALVSGAGDGGLCLWDVSKAADKGNKNKASWRNDKAHARFVRGVSFLQASESAHCFLSCSDDQTVKLWNTQREESLVKTFLGEHPFTSIDHHYTSNQFATSGNVVDIWDHHRSEPVQSFEWGHDTVTSIRFNKTETSVLAGTATDRSVILYDLRLATPLTRVVLAMRSNAVCWNPMETYYFTVANEDHQMYTFDMRKLDKPHFMFKGHVSAVMDLDYAPTGEEIVTGAYDQTMRIFDVKTGKSRDIYHTRRMQKVFCVKYSLDSKFVMSGSDDGSIRLWRANAAERVGYKTGRQQEALKYAEALKERYADIADVKKVKNHRYIPKPIKSAAKRTFIQESSIRRKEENRRKHAKPGSVPVVDPKDTVVVAKKA